jgi:dihydroorotase
MRIQEGVNFVKTLLKGGRVIDPATGTDTVTDVLIVDGRISAIGTALDAADVEQVVHLKDSQWVTPGLVDIHVHFRDPGRPDKETTESGANAAIAGGFTAVCVMPNTDPVIDTLQTFQYVKQAGDRTPIKQFIAPAVTKGMKGEELTEMGMLAAEGAVAFTDDGLCVMNPDRMRRALQYAAMFNLPIMCHAEDEHLSGHGCMHEGYVSTKLGLPGIPSASESVIVARDIELARMTGGHVHFTHMSTKESVALIRSAKADGLKVTADTTPHHLTLTDESVELSNYDPDFKMNPPLRESTDRDALIQALIDGTLDAVVTDHAPHTLDEKQLTFDSAPNGVVGLETALGLMLTHFFHSGKLSRLALIDRMSYGPAKILNLPVGMLKVGELADITIVDPDLEWIVDPSTFQSKSRNTPFKGMPLRGKAIMVFTNGNCVLGEDRLSTSARPSLAAGV